MTFFKEELGDHGSTSKNVLPKMERRQVDDGGGWMDVDLIRPENNPIQLKETF